MNALCCWEDGMEEGGEGVGDLDAEDWDIVEELEGGGWCWVDGLGGDAMVGASYVSLTEDIEGGKAWV